PHTGRLSIPMKKLCVVLLLLTGSVLSGFAQQAAAAPPAKLRVVTKPAEPFSFETKGEIGGYAVDLWRRVAKDAGLEFELKMLKSVPEVLEAVEKGQADVAIGALSITEDREKVLDFTQPFFDESGLQIVAHGRSSGSAFAAFGTLFNSSTLGVVGIMLAILFVVSNLLWLAERKKNPESFPEPYKEGLFESLWWCVSTMLTGGCENLAPRALPGRLVGVVWMIGGIALTSYVTATLAAAMTVNTLNSDIRNLGDLQAQPVATVTGSSAEVYLKELKYDVHGFENIGAAMDALKNNEVKGVIYDSPILRYYLSQHSGTDLQLVGSIFEKQAYGFALPIGSLLRKKINQTLLKEDVQQYRDELDKRWFAPAKDEAKN
ncbi:MAG: amino acid transporter substrate-binding protein family, partial [Verrucomicrobiaceae bacterium]|nr:amino acid transporter substrate-binding protein family [Verrucomicrobiaceae bacterium]